MTDLDIRDVLDRATRHLSPSPDLLEQVRRGGHGRLVRRRSVLGAGLATVVAGGTGAVWWAGGGSPTPTGSWLLDRPTAGDLADDWRYLRQVRAEWSKVYGVPPTKAVMRGEPHVVWAGSTPAGPAAFVAQRYFDGGEGLTMTVSFIEPTPTGPSLVWQENYTTDASRTTEAPGDPTTVLPRAVLLGERRDVLVVLDTGKPVRLSERVGYRPDGRIDRTFQTVTFDDGAAVLRLPSQRPLVSVALVAGPPNAPEKVGIFNTGPEGSVAVGGTFGIHHRALPDPAKVWPEEPAKAESEADAWVAGPLRPYLDQGGYEPEVDGPAWMIRGTTPDGRRLSLRTPVTHDGKLRALVVLGRRRGATSVFYGGEVKPEAPLPIAVRLPDRQGVLVAGEEVKLRYRTARGDWLPVRGDAALLPDAAAEVRVTPLDGRTVELPLP